MQKLFLKFFFGSTLVLIILVGVINFTIDPIQYYRRCSDRELFLQDRWQVASFIRNFDYNQIIVGTSMTQNFSLRFIQKVLHTKPIKLSISGSTILEQSKVIQTAIQTGKVNSIIWGLDQVYLNYAPGKWPDEFPIDLYQQGIRGAFFYLGNWDITRCSFRYLRGKLAKQSLIPIESYNVWHEQYEFSKAIVLKQYLKAKEKIQFSTKHNDQTDSSVQNAQSYENFDKEVVKLIQANPHIHFFIFLPPYSLANYKLIYKTSAKSYGKYLDMRQHIFERLCSLPNVELYDFETDLLVVSNLNNYKDLTHYSKYINEYIIYCIKNKKNIVEKNNISYHQTLFKQLPYKKFM